MFVAGSIDALYLGVVTGQSIDLMVIANGAANCVGTLYVYGEVGQWMVAQDGKTLLAIGDTGGAGWSIAETMQSKASKLRGEGKLRERACAAGLKDITESLSQAEWTAATHLLTPPEGLVRNATAPEGAVKSGDCRHHAHRALGGSRRARPRPALLTCSHVKQRQ
jgi:hypothetical protein